MNKIEQKLLQKVTELRKQIRQCNIEYYIYDAPSLTDAEYDKLMHDLIEIENAHPELLTPDSPTQTVGAPVQDKLQKHRHVAPMLSLDNAFSDSDIQDFMAKLRRFLSIQEFVDLFCEPKIDGLSFSLTYQNGVLVSAATRGDGYIGENVTDNIKTINYLPWYLQDAPELIEIRGEIYIDKTDFVKLNQQQEASNLPVFANPRNAAAGSVRQLDSSVTATRPLKYFIYGIGHTSTPIAFNQASLLDRLERWGFAVNPLKALAHNFSELHDFYSSLLAKRNDLAYEIDGIVYKVNDFALQQRLGFVSRSPRFAIAHKFPAIINKTKVINITTQVGRTGILTPVAELEPLKVGGAVISRATLHNFQEIARLDLRIGDTVSLHRAGDVIPKITEVYFDHRLENAAKVSPPDHCPSCGSKLHIHEDDVLIRCDNGLNCPQQRSASVIHFVSKNALNIEGLGERQIQFLLDHDMISNITDLFSLAQRNESSLVKLENMPGWGKKSVENLFSNIEAAKKIDLSKFIYSLGIKRIGESNARLLAMEFKTAANFLHSMQLLAVQDENISAKLAAIDGVGEKILEDLRDFFDCSDNITIVTKLLDILVISDYIDNSADKLLSGKNVVFTGTMSSLSRSEAKTQAMQLGAHVSSSVSSSTHMVIAGDKAGSKLSQARNLGVKIISEEEWREIVASNANTL